MAELGGIGARKDVNVYWLYILAAHNLNTLSESSADAYKCSKKEKKDIKKHFINKIEKELKQIEEDAAKGEKSGYRLPYRDLLILRKSIWILGNLADITKDTFQKMSREVGVILKSLRALGGGKEAKETRRIFLRLLKKNEAVDHFIHTRIIEIMDEVHSELQNEQKTVYATEKITVGKVGTRLVMKGRADSFARRMMIRFGPLMRMKRAAKHEETDEARLEEDMRKAKTRIDQLVKKVKELDNLHGRVDAHSNGLRKIKEQSEGTLKDVGRLMKESKRLMDEAEQMVKSAYRVFMFSFILMRGLLKLEEDQIEMDKEYILRHEIPRTIGLSDIQILEQNRKKAIQDLRNIEKFLLQLWNFSGEVKRKTTKIIQVSGQEEARAAAA